MKYLKSEIFYPSVFDENSRNNIIIQRKKYEAYLLKNYCQINEILKKAYEKYDEFHDYKIVKIAFLYQSNNSCNATIELSTLDLPHNLLLEFSDVCKVKYNKGDINEEDIILLCEIGYIKNHNYFSFCSLNSSELCLYFKSFNIIVIEK